MVRSAEQVQASASAVVALITRRIDNINADTETPSISHSSFFLRVELQFFEQTA